MLNMRKEVAKKKQLLSKHEKIVKYKWEFLRRNKDYRTDYQNHQKYDRNYWLLTYDIKAPIDPGIDYCKMKKLTLKKLKLQFSVNYSPTMALKEAEFFSEFDLKLTA